MRHIFLILLLPLLLWGCAADTTEETEESSETIAIETTVPPETRPVDPMQMLLDSMTVEEKVGQLFLARCPDENVLADIETYHLGGYLLFGRDFDGETPDSFRIKIDSYQAASPIPLLIAVDEEGGTVCRVSRNSAFRSRRFPSPRESYGAGGMEQVLSIETEKASLLRNLGINVNMGPVADITTGFGAFMHARSLGEDPDGTGRFIASTVNIYENYALGSVLKHFPGYGNNSDTHTDMVRDSRSLTSFEEADLLPFTAGISAGADAILVSHTVVEAFDAENPASLSPAIHEYLRSTMGFEGVIMTDDLVMEAITTAYGPEEAAVLSILAGNDLLCSSEYQIQYAAVLEAVRSGRIPLEHLEGSVRRVLEWKKELGLIF